MGLTSFSVKRGDRGGLSTTGCYTTVLARTIRERTFPLIAVLADNQPADRPVTFIPSALS